MGRRKTLRVSRLLTAPTIDQSGKHQPGHKWKASTWAFSGPPNVLTLNCGPPDGGRCGASYDACASGATPCKFETRQPARPAGKARADRQFQRRVRRASSPCTYAWTLIFSYKNSGAKSAPLAQLIVPSSSGTLKVLKYS